MARRSDPTGGVTPAATSTSDTVVCGDETTNDHALAVVDPGNRTDASDLVIPPDTAAHAEEL